MVYRAVGFWKLKQRREGSFSWTTRAPDTRRPWRPAKQGGRLDACLCPVAAGALPGLHAYRTWDKRFPPRRDLPPGPRKRSAAGRDSRLRSGFTARWRLAPYRAHAYRTWDKRFPPPRDLSPGPRKRSSAGRDSRRRSSPGGLRSGAFRPGGGRAQRGLHPAAQNIASSEIATVMPR
ncbi:Uncharacterised protein [Klebsiella pneumoniae]|uniref:Uncharacterized protein n=1 Tax=Klebsiella pneumoniae TaxID=573 RepID=A0A2X3EPG4_KLEPN|nr:Uncharacterised protein [Klebsiella pneumoniae]